MHCNQTMMFPCYKWSFWQGLTLLELETIILQGKASNLRVDSLLDTSHPTPHPASSLTRSLVAFLSHFSHTSLSHSLRTFAPTSPSSPSIPCLYLWPSYSIIQLSTNHLISTADCLVSSSLCPSTLFQLLLSNTNMAVCIRAPPEFYDGGW